jgi:hypothetical protein
MRLRRKFSTFDAGPIIAALGLALAFATQAFAQGAAPAPPAQRQAPAEKIDPAPSPPMPSQTPDENLSRRLDKNEGVIKPPPTGDAEIHLPPKGEDAGRMPVIPPPGSPGGRQDVQPK